MSFTTAKTGIAKAFVSVMSEMNWLKHPYVSAQCADIGGTQLTASLCVMPQNHNQAGLITYKDGRVVDIVDFDEKGRLTVLSADGKHEIILDGVDEASLGITLEMQGTMIGDCYGMAHTASTKTPTRPLYILHDPWGISPMAHSPEFVAELRDRLVEHEAEVFFCSNRENTDETGMRMKRSDVGLRIAIAGLMTSESPSHSPLLDSLRVFQEPDLKELDQRFCDMIPADSPYKSTLCETR